MSSFGIKLLASFFMLIDHIGFVLFPNILTLRMIGRLAFPLFAFQAGISYEHTKNKRKYILRLIIFTIVSQIPYYLSLKAANSSEFNTLNIGATLTFRCFNDLCMG